MSKCTGCECCNTSDAAAELNAERLAHLATRTELDKAVAWLDRCQWARSVIDLDSGPLEVQLATAMQRVERLTAEKGHGEDEFHAMLRRERALRALVDSLEANCGCTDETDSPCANCLRIDEFKETP